MMIVTLILELIWAAILVLLQSAMLVPMWLVLPTRGNLLRLVLSMSAAGGALALALLALKPWLNGRKGREVSQEGRYWGWKAVMIAFLVPLTVMLTAPVPLPTDGLQAAIEQYALSDPVALDELAREAEGAVSGVGGDRLARLAGQWLFHVLDWVIPAVSAVLIVATQIGYLRFSHAMRRAARPARPEERALLQKYAKTMGEPELYRSPLISTAMLVGVFRPAIYLPDREYTPAQLEDILLHELTHFCRMDVLVKWFAALMTHIHWFNPLAWLARRELDRACELSCDASVIRNFDRARRLAYGETLLAVAAEGRGPRSAGSAAVCEEKRSLKERLAAILDSKPVTRAGLILSCTFVAVIFCAALALGASPEPAAIVDPASVTAATRIGVELENGGDPSLYAFVPYEEAFRFLDEESFRDGTALSQPAVEELARLLNTYRKVAYYPDVQPVMFRSGTWIRLDRADGGYFLVHYWYNNGFSLNPNHPGEDEYCTVVASFDEQGELERAWRMEYYFDLAFMNWEREYR